MDYLEAQSFSQVYILEIDNVGTDETVKLSSTPEFELNQVIERHSNASVKNDVLEYI